jgi:hypothetical protein
MSAQTTAVKASADARVSRFLALVYLVMTVGMVVTALVATWVAGNEQLILRILFRPWFAFGLFILQIILVTVLSGAVMRLSPVAAVLIFLLYSALTGMTISSIFIYYSQSTVAYAFWMAAGMFLFSSVVGLFIRRDLSGIGRFLLLVLMGWTFGLFLSWFFPAASGFNEALNITGIILFAALTAWDTQQLKQLADELEGRQGMGGLVVLGALKLYLDFINLFLLLLRTSRR